MVFEYKEMFSSFFKNDNIDLSDVLKRGYQRQRKRKTIMRLIYLNE